MKRSSIFSLAMIAGGVLSATAFGTVHTVTDGNSLVRIDDSSQAGMMDWVVDGTDHMFQQWFWFRVAGDTQERSIDTLPLLGAASLDTNPFVDPAPDSVAALYGNNAGLTIQPTWTLRGGRAGSNSSDVTESIVITNHGRTFLDLSFFQYCDFDLNGTPGGDVVQMNAPLFNTVVQSEGPYALSETVVTPAPTHHMVGPYAQILNMLNDGNADNLNDFSGPLGPGDMTWAFQWDMHIAPGASIVISKDKGIVPSPGALALVSLGGLMALRRKR